MDQVSAERSSVAGPSMLFEAIAGVGAIVLAILGLTRILPHYMAAIGTIVVGGALVEGSALGARRARERCAARAAERRGARGCGGRGARRARPARHVGAGVATGGGDRVRCRTADRRLFRAAVAVAQVRRRACTPRPRFDPMTGVRSSPSACIRRAEHHRARSRGRSRDRPTGAQLLVGLSAVVLGILALLGHSPLILILVALLCVGCDRTATRRRAEQLADQSSAAARRLRLRRARGPRARRAGTTSTVDCVQRLNAGRTR